MHGYARFCIFGWIMNSAVGPNQKGKHKRTLNKIEKSFKKFKVVLFVTSSPFQNKNYIYIYIYCIKVKTNLLLKKKKVKTNLLYKKLFAKRK